MVEKWTNEPCSGVDEVVNTFWVLTLSKLRCMVSFANALNLSRSFIFRSACAI